MRILLTNDDGIHAPGLVVLERIAAALSDDVWVCAPSEEQSGAGHSLTLHMPVRLVQHGERRFAVTGTPTDAVNLALKKLFDGRGPDLVISGINGGENLGDDVTYSGTVAGALEGALLGHQAIAVSLQFTRGEWDFGPAAAVAASLAAAVLERPLPTRTFLSVNVPQGRILGLRVTVQARRNHITKVARRLDPRSRPYFWIEEAQDDWEPHDRSDRQAVHDGYVSVTPLQPDMTDHSALSLVESLTQGVLTV